VKKLVTRLKGDKKLSCNYLLIGKYELNCQVSILTLFDMTQIDNLDKLCCFWYEYQIIIRSTFVIITYMSYVDLWFYINHIFTALDLLFT
jgi:hypothetical protein